MVRLPAIPRLPYRLFREPPVAVRAIPVPDVLRADGNG